MLVDALGGEADSRSSRWRRWSIRQPHLRYPWAYVLFVLASTLDILLTWLILALGGAEVNPIADAVLKFHGLWGVIGFKFSLTVFVILMCEVIGRRRETTGLRLAQCAVGITALPVVLSLWLLVNRGL